MKLAPPVAIAESERRTVQVIGTVFRNTVLLIIGQLIVQASMALIGIVVARYLGRESYGQYALAFSFGGTVGQLFALGTDWVVIREIARDPSRYQTMFGSAMWIRLIMFPLVTIGTTLVTVLLGYDIDQRGYIFLGLLVLGLTTLSDLPRSVFQAHQQMVYDTITRGAERVIALMLIFAATVYMGVRDIGMLLMLTVVSSIIGVIATHILLLRHIGKPKFGHPREALRLVRESFPLVSSMILLVVYEQLPVIMLSRLSSYDEVASFVSALSLIMPFSFIAIALRGSLLPSLSVALRNRGLEIDTHIKSIGFNLLLAIPIAIVMYIAAPFLIHMLYGDQFNESIPVLRALVLLVPVLFMVIYGNTLSIAGAIQRKLLWIVLLNLVLTIVLGFILIPAGGSMGAVITRILAPAVGTVILLVLAPRWVRRPVSGANSA